MSPAWWAVAGVGLVALAVTAWRARMQQPQHDAWIRAILRDDREVAELEAALRRVAREHRS